MLTGGKEGKEKGVEGSIRMLRDDSRQREEGKRV